jgi:hypothetical protein
MRELRERHFEAPLADEAPGTNYIRPYFDLHVFFLAVTP